MSRYFIHVEDEKDIVLDEVGVELPDTAAALDHCRSTVARIVTSPKWRGVLSGGLKLHIVNDIGQRVLYLDGYGDTVRNTLQLLH
jgi:hypothetical protein